MRCVFEMPNENDKLVSKKGVKKSCHTLLGSYRNLFETLFLFVSLVKWIVGISTKFIGKEDWALHCITVYGLNYMKFQDEY